MTRTLTGPLSAWAGGGRIEIEGLDRVLHEAQRVMQAPRPADAGLLIVEVYESCPHLAELEAAAPVEGWALRVTPDECREEDDHSDSVNFWYYQAGVRYG